MAKRKFDRAPRDRPAAELPAAERAAASRNADGTQRLGPPAVDDRRFRAVADYTYDWESWHAPDGRLMWVNPAVERTTGYSIDECLGMLDYPLPMVVDEDRPAVAEALAAARQGSSGENVEFGCRRRDGRRRWLSLAWQPMYAADGEHLGFRTSVRDVTELRRLRDELRRHAEHLEQLVAERTSKLRRLEDRQHQMEKLAALGQLAAGVAHEINNPLAGMRNAFELIKSSLPASHEHYDLLELVDREIERISGIVHQMYQLYRRAPQLPAEFDLVRVTQEVVTMLEGSAGRRGVRIRLAADETPLRASLAEGEVKQILYNLIRNAVQASPAGEAVTVTLTAEGRNQEREIRVEIDDAGAGIAPEVLPHIFDPFFSTKNAEEQGGMGLGLSVSRSLIEAMGGRIEVASLGAAGTRFTAVFPARLEPATEASDG